MGSQSVPVLDYICACPPALCMSTEYEYSVEFSARVPSPMGSPCAWTILSVSPEYQIRLLKGRPGGLGKVLFGRSIVSPCLLQLTNPVAVIVAFGDCLAGLLRSVGRVFGFSEAMMGRHRESNVLLGKRKKRHHSCTSVMRPRTEATAPNSSPSRGQSPLKILCLLYITIPKLCLGCRGQKVRRFP